MMKTLSRMFIFMHSRRSQVALWIPAVCWCGFIFWLSSRSQLEPPDIPLPPHADKLVHFALYAILAWLSYRPAQVICGNKIDAAFLAVLFCAVYGVTDEFHQMHVPGRTADLMDWLADICGATAAMIWSTCIQSRVWIKPIK